MNQGTKSGSMRQSLKKAIGFAVISLALFSLSACGSSDITALETTWDLSIRKADLAKESELMEDQLNQTDLDLQYAYLLFDPGVVSGHHQVIKYAPENQGAVSVEVLTAKNVETAKNVYGKLVHRVKNDHLVARQGRKVYEVVAPYAHPELEARTFQMFGFAPTFVRQLEQEVVKTGTQLKNLRQQAEEEFQQKLKEQEERLRQLRQDKVLE